MRCTGIKARSAVNLLKSADRAWMDGAAGIASLKGFDLLMMVKDKPVQVCMNAGTQYMKVFPRNEIEWLLGNAQIE